MKIVNVSVIVLHLHHFNVIVSGSRSTVKASATIASHANPEFGDAMVKATILRTG
jgi:hypothetical protein